MENRQSTIMYDVCVEGVNVYNGKREHAIFHPAERNSGLVFIVDNHRIPAKLDYAKHKNKAIWLDNGETKVGLVEHLLSGVYALGIDNLEIELSGNVCPTTNNCAFEYFDNLKDARAYLDAPKTFWKYNLQEPAIIRAQDVLPKLDNQPDVLTAKKSEGNFIINYEAFYPHKVVREQNYTFIVDEEKYESDIAKARPPGFVKNNFGKRLVSLLGDAGFIGLNNRNYLFITSKKSTKYANPPELGVRFEGEEFVRHKLTDVTGTLALTGKQYIDTEFTFHMSGHRFDIPALRKLFFQGCFKEVRI